MCEVLRCKISQLWGFFFPTGDCLQKKPIDSQNEDFGSRVVVFIVIGARKLCAWSVWSLAFISADLVFRVDLKKNGGGWMDYVIVMQSIFFLFVFVHKIVKAWLKSFGHSLKNDYDELAVDVTRFIISLLCAAINFVAVYIVVIRFLYTSLESRGQFGDSFGFLNAFISTGALICAWIAIWLQHRQMVEEKRQYLRGEERTRQSYEAKVLDQKRMYCPVVVAKSLDGTLKISMANADQIIVQLRLTIECSNCLDHVLLNLVKLVGVADGQQVISFYPKEPCVPYVLSRSNFKIEVDFLLFQYSKNDFIEKFRGDFNLRIAFKIAFMTAQQYAYVLQEEYMMDVDVDRLDIRGFESFAALIRAIENHLPILTNQYEYPLNFRRTSNKFGLRGIEMAEFLKYMEGAECKR